MKYFKEPPFSVTICDKEGKVLEMNDLSLKTFCPDGGNLVGTSLFDCHHEPARTKIAEMLQNHEVNAYTIEKKGVKKLIYQSPWYENGEFAGYIELSLVLPAELPHFVREG